MKSAAAFRKNLSVYRDDPWVQVMVPGLEGLSKQDFFAFRASQIKSLRALGPQHTLLKLAEGPEYLIALSYGTLMETLDQPDGNRVDLAPFTLIDGKEALFKRLKEEFRRAQEQEQEPDIAAVTIKAFVRASEKSDFKLFSFAGRDLRLSAMEEGGSIHGGKNIRLSLYPPQEAPFGGQKLLIEGQLDTFRRLCREAVARGETEVDMTEYSMQKFKNASPQECRQRETQKAHRP